MVPGLVYENKKIKKIAIKESDKNSVATATREDNYATLREDKKRYAPGYEESPTYSIPCHRYHRHDDGII